MSNSDELLRSYAIISSLKENIPETHEISDSWVKEFHAAIAKLESSTGLDLSDFKVSSEHIKKSVGSSNYLTHEVHYRQGLWCERSVLIHKISSILVYFTGLNTAPEKKIGFGR